MLRKRRVLLVGPWKWAVGGVTTFMQNVVRSPLAESYEFVQFNTARPPKQNVTDNYGYGAMFRGGARRVVAGAFITLMHLAYFPFALLFRRPDIVQIQSSDFQTFWEAAIYVAISRALGIPVLMRLGGWFDRFYLGSSVRAQASIRRVLMWPDRLIVQSDYWLQFIAGLGRTNGVLVVGNSVPEELTAPASRPVKPVPVCLFAIGSNATWKGFDEVLEAMVLLKFSGVDVRCRVIGATDALRERVNSTIAASLMQLEGTVDHTSMIAAMRGCDVFLLPSHSEGFPNALIEAMATGLACIVTPVGAVPEIVGKVGAIVIPVQDSHALAGAIRRLISDPNLRNKLGETARQIVVQRYVQSAMLPRLDSGWQSLLDEMRGTTKPEVACHS
jgi:glycosyltransferase involved in cell wall biosynthesis